jgi:hypothetical protein
MEDNLKDIWKNISPPISVSIESKTIIQNLTQKVKKMDRSLFRRDFLEVLAAIFVIIFFIGASLSYGNFIKKVGCWGIALGASWVIYKIVDVRKYKKGLKQHEGDLIQHLHIYKVYMEKQMQLLDNILYWYILPLGLPAILLHFGDDFSSISKWLRFLILNVGVGILIHYLNKNAAKGFKPIIDDITKQLDILKNQDL